MPRAATIHHHCISLPVGVTSVLQYALLLGPKNGRVAPTLAMRAPPRLLINFAEQPGRVITHAGMQTPQVVAPFPTAERFAVHRFLVFLWKDSDGPRGVCTWSFFREQFEAPCCVIMQGLPIR